MKVNIAPGRYIVAVSGGVDSMVLLSLLSKTKTIDIVVAHFDHGIRPDSHKDALLVKKTAQSGGLKFELGEASLGTAASEDLARQVRYEFLYKLLERYEANAIVTAHHQDDLIETAFINIIRGTGPKGLVAIMNNPSIIRPLIPYTKKEIIEYAIANKISWAEDQTNEDQKYLRNYIRSSVVSKMTVQDKRTVVITIKKANDSINELQKLISDISRKIIKDGSQIDRQAYAALPTTVGKELLYSWLKTAGATDLDRKTINRLDLAIRTSSPGKKQDIKKGLRLDFTIQNAQIINTL